MSVSIIVSLKEANASMTAPGTRRTRQIAKRTAIMSGSNGNARKARSQELGQMATSSDAKARDWGPDRTLNKRLVLAV
jgi:hypothetical protein